jgi:hypothetical protein
MSYNLTPVIPSNQVQGSSWVERLRKHAISVTPNSSKDIEVRTTTAGTTFHLKEGVIPLLGLNYGFLNEGVYALPSNVDPNTVDAASVIAAQVTAFFAVAGRTDSSWWTGDSAYSIGDIVRMQGFLNGTDAGINPDTGNHVTTIAPSTWICVSPIPYNYSQAQKDLLLSTADINAGLGAIISATFRKTGVNYNPIFESSNDPQEPKQVAHKTTDGKGRYWELISGGVGSSTNGGDVWL